jgi:hypothetical protein
MRYDIDDETIKRAVRCEKDYACLLGEEGLHCRPSDVMSGASADISLIQCPEDEACVYCQSFGSTSICECPVRTEIFRRYGK